MEQHDRPVGQIAPDPSGDPAAGDRLPVKAPGGPVGDLEPESLGRLRSRRWELAIGRPVEARRRSERLGVGRESGLDVSHRFGGRTWSCLKCRCPCNPTSWPRARISRASSGAEAICSPSRKKVAFAPTASRASSTASVSPGAGSGPSSKVSTALPLGLTRSIPGTPLQRRARRGEWSSRKQRTESGKQAPGRPLDDQAYVGKTAHRWETSISNLRPRPTIGRDGSDRRTRYRCVALDRGEIRVRRRRGATGSARSPRRRARLAGFRWRPAGAATSRRS